ncbi:sensor histidine kinase [Runella rosea]|nr:7TM diverse intracellular signaling domain-containing protein [Runella rosea]
MYLLDTSKAITLEQVLQRSKEFKANKNSYVNFKTTEANCWLRFDIVSEALTPQNISLITSGLDSVFLYVIEKDSLVNTYLQGTHFSLANRASLAPLQTFHFTLEPHRRKSIFLKARMDNYPLSVYPLTLLSAHSAFAYLQKEELFRSVYIGGMIIIVLFAAYMALFFRGRLYLYYLLCAGCSLCMVLIYNDYHYLFFEESPAFIRNKNAYAFLVTLLPVFYLLFAKEFVSYGYVAPKRLLTTSYVTISISVVLLCFIINEEDNLLRLRPYFYMTVIANTSLMLFYVFKALKNGYRPAWLYVLATFPVLAIGTWEALSDFHQTPIQQMHDLYYSFTLYEMYILMLGLAGRFKVYQEGRKKLQQEMFEMQIQIEEKIRQRIGLDLHDKVGGLLAALKINLDFFQKKYEYAQFDSYRKIFEILDTAADETRRISHSMMSNQLQERGLLSMLKELYLDVEKPRFVIQTRGMEHRLSPSLEMTLYAIINECVTNALKHAQAQQIEIQLNRTKNDELTLIVEDDGEGFDSNKSSRMGKGLVSLTTRVREHLGGDLIIDSTPGKGTVVMVKIKIKK